MADHRVKLTETKFGTTTPVRSWGVDSDTLLEQYEINAGDTIGVRPSKFWSISISRRPGPLVHISKHHSSPSQVAFDMSDEKVLRYYHNGEYLGGQDVRCVTTIIGSI